MLYSLKGEYSICKLSVHTYEYSRTGISKKTAYQQLLNDPLYLSVVSLNRSLTKEQKRVLSKNSTSNHAHSRWWVQEKEQIE